MLELLFKINGVEKSEMVVFDSLEEMQDFIKNIKDEVLATHPTATDITYGKAYVGVGN